MRGLSGLAIAFTCKFLYIAHHFVWLRLNTVDLAVNREKVRTLYIIVYHQKLLETFSFPGYLHSLMRWSESCIYCWISIYSSPFQLAAVYSFWPWCLCGEMVVRAFSVKVAGLTVSWRCCKWFKAPDFSALKMGWSDYSIYF